MKRIILIALAGLSFASSAMAQEFQSSKLKWSMWGISSGDGLRVATGTDGAVVVSRKDSPWTGRVLDGEPLLIATAIANGRDIFVAGSTGGFVNGKALILRSRDAGKSFETSISGTGATIYELKFHNRTFGHASGVDGTLLRTTDGGNSWQRIATGTKSKLWALHFFNWEFGLVGGGDTPWQNDDKSSGLIRRTIDGGKTWQTVHAGQNRISDFSFVDDRVGYAGGVGGTLLKTEDGGKTWTHLPKTPLGAIVNAVAFETPACGLIVGSGGTAYATQDGGQTWPTAVKVTNGSFLEDLHPATGGGYWVAAGDGTVGRIKLAC